MELEQILHHLADISSIPVTYYKKSGEVFHSPDHAYLKKLTTKVPLELMQSAKTADCLLTDELLCYGLVKVTGSTSFAIFGPVTAIACENQRAQQILKKYNLPTTETGELLSYFKTTPICSLERFSNFIIFANYVINHETIGIDQLLPKEYYISKEILPEPPEIGEVHTTHNAEAYEREMYSLIKYGKYHEMLDFIKQSMFTGNEGSLSSEMLRHQKNLIISSIAVAARQAVEGGLDYETSMSLADSYILKADIAPSIHALSALHNSMLKTYAKLVAEKKINNSDSAISTKVNSYVEQHISEKIRVTDIASNLNLSRSYLSVQFKKETGINLNDFINQMKIDEAKRLLATSEKTITYIAALLAFSSQSYFDSIFKEYTGMTPRQYRESNSH